ncbi:MAG: hypothetical protein DHS20C17_14150 [Cyclobacteriaceae bacterium]|nr:MAG: hypothetical protein DHS20C17_14150 [Cyclobacteriaceae bacterium]
MSKVKRVNINAIVPTVILGVITILFAQCGSPTPESEPQIAIPETFTNLCSSCHGTNLKGETAQSLLDGSWQFGSRTGDLFRSIKFGHPHFGMPSWGSVLDDEQINSLVDFLIETEKQLGITKPAIPKEIETQDYLVNVETFIDSLDTPWGIAFPDENTVLITERPGRLRVVNNGVLNSEPVAGIPEVIAMGQGGLLDVVLDPDYSSNGWVYLSFSHGIHQPEQEDTLISMTSIVRGKIKDNSWQEQQIIYQAPGQDYLPASHHYGGRISFDNQGYLYFTVGDRGNSELAQDLKKPNGKVHRIHADGSVPESNPFYGQTEALNTIYSYGHRNPQGITKHPETGEIWEAEHGPLGGDELNLIKPSLNYGWPLITHGINYDGEIISEVVRMEGMEQPALYWKPSIAVCGIDFYSGDLFPKWNNQLLVSALRFEEVQLLDIEGDRVIYQQTLLKNAGRVRQTSPGPDGAIYVVLNKPDKVLKLTPKS